MWTSSSLIRRSVKNTSGFFKHRAQSLEDPGEGLIKNNDLMFKNLKTVQTSLPVKAKSRLRDTSFEASFRHRKNIWRRKIFHFVASWNCIKSNFATKNSFLWQKNDFCHKNSILVTRIQFFSQKSFLLSSHPSVKPINLQQRVNPTKKFAWAYTFRGNLVPRFPVNLPPWCQNYWDRLQDMQLSSQERRRERYMLTFF